MIQKLFTTLLLFFLSGGVFVPALIAQDIAINEIMAANSSLVADEEGDYEDWIELYNYGSEPVDLEGYGLSDDYNNPFRWVFPSVVIEPGEFLLVWASGKDRRLLDDSLNGVMREVYHDIPGATISDLVNHPSYPDDPSERHIVSNGFDAPVNVSDEYGQRMHAWVEAPQTGEYIFWIASDDNGLLYLSTDEDPENISSIASVPGWTHHMEFDKYYQQQSGPVHLEEGQRYYIKALMKEDWGGDNLTVRWQLPSQTIEEPIPHERLFWVGGELHTNFSISSQGEEVLLTRPDSILVDEHPPMYIPVGVSRGRVPDGTGEWYYFDQPTPRESNTTPTFEGISSDPFFSSPGGFYQQDFDLMLFHEGQDAVILYTLDGSKPSMDNLDGSTYLYKNRYRVEYEQEEAELLEKDYRTHEYSGELIPIRDRTGDPDSQTLVNTRLDQYPITPYDDPLRGTVVRAKAFREGSLPSEVVSASYIIRESAYSIPAISFIMPEKSLFSYYDGLYVPGVSFDNWRAENWNAQLIGSTPANWHNRGREWERETHITLMDTCGYIQLDRRAGVRIHGAFSRSYPQKSLRIYARRQYGESEIAYPVFPTKDTDRFKRFILRAAGNDTYNTFFRDAMVQQLVLNRPLDKQHWLPTATFINGEYWGLLNIRDRFDKYFLAYEHGVDPENIDLLTHNAQIKEGNALHYNQMMDYAVDNDLSDSLHYQHMNTLMDVDNFAEYYAIQIYVANTDWPGNNIDFWRLRTSEYMPDAPYGHDGRWRWLLYDLDFGFGLFHGSWHNTLVFASADDDPGWPNPPWSTRLFRNLLENNSFRIKMINRFADLMNVVFDPDHVVSKIMEMENTYSPVMGEHISRWPVIGSLSNWQDEVNRMVEFAQSRPGHVKNHVEEFFDLTGHYTITLNVASGEGDLRLNTLELDNPSGWEGIGFNDVPIELEAIPGKNYQFSHWEGAVESTAENITVSSDVDISLEAHFEKTDEPVLINFWVFDDTMPNNTPLETVDDSYHLVNQARVSFSSALHGYPFYPGHELWRKASMERRNAPTPINYHPEANDNVTYEMAGMRGLQVKQPFVGDNGENTLIFHLPTNGYSDIVFRFAAKDENAADELMIDYAVDENDGEWHTTGLDSSVLALSAEYQIFELDFSGIEGVNNNGLFKIRLRFAGEDMAADLGGRVSFNNISLHGVPMDEIIYPPQVVSPLSLKKGIENGNPITVNLEEVFHSPQGMPLTFTAVSSRPGFVEAHFDGSLLDLYPNRRGDAKITLTANDGINPAVSKSFRVLVYPEAHVLSHGTFTFTEWDEGHPELTYPENMLFLQSDVDDPQLNTSLLYPYHMEHDDYHLDDHETRGFPYNNTGRTRINGLGGDGISFINTGRGRDLGGAMVAINTMNMDNVRLRWTGATLLENERTYAMRLQYRVGTHGPFHDVVHNGQVSQIISGVNNFVMPNRAIKLPAAAMDEPYVQLLWRYYHIAGNSGPRAQIRLDEIQVGDMLSDDALITSFDFLEADIASLVIDQVQQNVVFTLDGETDVSSLTPVIGISEFAEIHPSPGSDQQYEPMDFSEPVMFTVSSESGLVENAYFVMADTGVGVHKLFSQRMKVYPNPARNFIRMESAVDMKKVDLLDISGAVLYSRSSPGEQTRIPVNAFENGIYFLRVFTGDEIFVHKVVIQN